MFSKSVTNRCNTCFGDYIIIEGNTWLPIPTLCEHFVSTMITSAVSDITG